MKYRFFLVFFASLTIGFPGVTQSLKKIRKTYIKGDFEKVYSLTQKALEKDSLNVGCHYFLSVLFLDSAVGRYHRDSSRFWIERGIEWRNTISEDQQKAFVKAEIPLSALDSQRLRVIRSFYQYTLTTDTLAVYNRFLSLFPDAEEYPRVLFLRDSIAYSLAQEYNSWEVYKQFMAVYPASVFFDQAKRNYETLLFKEMTGSGALSDYIQFLDKYPETPFRKEVEEAIFTKSTRYHRPEDYQSFISKYPDSHLRSRAANLLYYLWKEDTNHSMTNFSFHPNADSLRELWQKEQLKLLPLISDEHFTFFDTEGTPLEGVKFEDIQQKYLCQLTTDEWLIGKSKMEWTAKNRIGSMITSGFVSVEDLGEALMLVDFGRTKKVLHKSGLEILPFAVSDALVVFEKWIAFKKDLFWGMASFNGEVVLQPAFKSIAQVGSFLMLENSKGFYVSSPELILAQTPTLNRLLISDFEMLTDSLILGFLEDKETLISSDLKNLLLLDNYRIYWQPDYCYVKRPNGISQFFDPIKQQLFATPYLSMYENTNWQLLRPGNFWSVTVKKTGTTLSKVDSLSRIDEDHLFIQLKDSAYILFPNGRLWYLKDPKAFEPMISRDGAYGSSCILYSENKVKKVVNLRGEQILEATYESINYLNDSTFVFKVKGKEGVVNSKKEVLLKPEYDLIEGHKGLLVLLKKGLIGCYDLERNAYIPPMYQARVERFGTNYLVSKDGKYGLVDEKNKMICPIIYEELQSWNDSSYWTNTDHSWELKSMGGATLMSSVTLISPWKVHEELQLFLYLQEEKYGIIHPGKGKILPPQYNDIINLGTSTAPLFFAEQHLQTADFFVVTYFDSHGVAFKSQAYRSEEYDRIYCEESEVSGNLDE